MPETIQAAMIRFLQQAQNLLITGHVDPDADCIGSMLALYEAFGGEDKGWQLALRDDAPCSLQYLPGLRKIRKPEQLAEGVTAVLLVDCGDVVRAGGQWLTPYRDLPHYCIDHHTSNSFDGELSLIEPEASSTGELITMLCEEAGREISLDAATNLYSAIVSDTGCFRYLNTTPESLEMGARLLRKGVDLEEVRINLFESRSPANIAMLTVALNHLETRCEGKLCYTYVPRQEMLKHGANSDDLHNIINYTLSVAGVKLGIFFEEHEGFVKISLRSRRGWRVDQLAVELGGGGHKLAAGCRMSGSLEEVLPRVLHKAQQLLEAK